MSTESLEKAVHRAIKQGRRRALDGEEVVITVAEGSFYVLVLPLPGSKPVEDDSQNEGFRPAWKEDFLVWLSHGKSIETAAELSGVTRRHAYRVREEDLKFAKAWDEARAQCDVTKVTVERIYHHGEE